MRFLLLLLLLILPLLSVSAFVFVLKETESVGDKSTHVYVERKPHYFTYKFVGFMPYAYYKHRYKEKSHS